MCIALCHACIIYVHSMFPMMSKACTHLGVHEHVCQMLYAVSHMTYQCVANEIIEILARVLTYYLLKSHQTVWRTSLGTFSIGSPNCHMFLSCMNNFVHSGWIQWNAVTKIYNEGDQSLPMVGCQRTCFFPFGRKVWIRLRRSISSHLWSFSTNIYIRTTRMQ